MIHISIPEITKIAESNGTSCDAYKIHINGAYHCTLRYSLLLRLHESIKKQFGDVASFEFPPKKIKYFMSDKLREERREQLQYYLRSVCQHPLTASSLLVTKFFLEAQKESINIENTQNYSNNQLPVYLLDGSKKLVPCDPGDCTGVVLERFAQAVNLQYQSIRSFGLFIVCKSDTCAYNVDDNPAVFNSVVRWLQDFECPLLSLYTICETAKKPHKILFRKSVWDVTLERELLSDRIAVNLLYAQAVCDVESWQKSKLTITNTKLKWSPLPDDVLRRLKSLQETKSIHEYLQLCQIQQRYGFMYFEPCMSDYPAVNTNVQMAIGSRQLVLLYRLPGSSDYVESAFKVTRIRCWKLSNSDHEITPNLSFEYLVSRDHFEWISVYGKQCVLLSLCLQSMVDEIVKTRGLNSVDLSSTSSRTSSSGSPCYNNGHSAGNNLPGYESFHDLHSNSNSTSTIRRTHFSSSSPFSNEAFNTITDEDL